MNGITTIILTECKFIPAQVGILPIFQLQPVPVPVQPARQPLLLAQLRLVLPAQARLPVPVRQQQLHFNGSNTDTFNSSSI